MLRAVLSGDNWSLAAAFSPDGKTIVTGAPTNGPRGAGVWDIATGQLLGRLLPASDLDRVVTFSSDGKTVHTLDAVYSTGDVHMVTWDSASRKQLGRLAVKAGGGMLLGMRLRPTVRPSQRPGPATPQPATA